MGNGIASKTRRVGDCKLGIANFKIEDGERSLNLKFAIPNLQSSTPPAFIEAHPAEQTNQ
jgi:hypothetical protein